MPFYDRAPQTVHTLLKDVIERFHPFLKTAGVTFDLLFATAEGDDPAVMLHGYPCLAVIRATGAKERALGHADSEILIAKERFLELPKNRHFALLDHELYHLKPETDKFGAFKVDDYRRPKLSMRKHDRQFGWFDDVARRNGEDSMEIWQAREFAKEAGQLYLGLDMPARV